MAGNSLQDIFNESPQQWGDSYDPTMDGGNNTLYMGAHSYGVDPNYNPLSQPGGGSFEQPIGETGEFRFPDPTNPNYQIYHNNANNSYTPLYGGDKGSFGEFLTYALPIATAGMNAAAGAGGMIPDSDLVTFDTTGAQGYGSGGWNGTDFTGVSESAPFLGAAGELGAGYYNNNMDFNPDGYTGPSPDGIGSTGGGAGDIYNSTKKAVMQRLGFPGSMGGNLLPNAQGQTNYASPTLGGLGQLFQTGAGFLAGNRAAKQYNGQIDTLNNLYSVNSPYANQMKQELARKDAAAGRRSQYGPRETQLAAMLADKQGQVMSSPGYNAAMNNRVNAQNQGLGTLMAMMNKNPRMLQQAMGSLQGMFGGGSGGGVLPQQQPMLPATPFENDFPGDY